MLPFEFSTLIHQPHNFRQRKAPSPTPSVDGFRNWDQGWLQFRAQEEAVKLWVKERVQVLGIASSHTGIRTQC